MNGPIDSHLRRKPKHINVVDLDSALEAYWSATSRREDQAAYHEILLFGGRDGWGYPDSWRGRLARWLRLLAVWIDRK